MSPNAVFSACSPNWSIRFLREPANFLKARDSRQISGHERKLYLFDPIRLKLKGLYNIVSKSDGGRAVL